MAEFNIHEATSSLPQLFALVEQGEDVTIIRDGEPVADRVPQKSGHRHLGALAGTINLPEGWDPPMTDEHADRFLGAGR